MLKAVSVLVLASALAGGAPEVEVESVLILCDERPPVEPFKEFLEKRARFKVEVVDQDAFPRTLAAYRGIYQYVHRPLTATVEKALVRYVEDGGRLVTLHHGISSSKLENPEFLSFAGIMLFRKPVEEGGWKVLGNVTAELVNLQPDHFVTTHDVRYDGTTRYTPSDAPSVEQELSVLKFPRTEVFLNQHFTDGRQKTVLFGIRGEDSASGRIWMQDRGGWLQPKGKGWAFYFQVGHAASDFQKAPYCQVLLNCLLWRPPS